MNGSSSDFSVHAENGIEYLIKSSCLRREREEIVALRIYIYIFFLEQSNKKKVKINEIKWQVPEPVGHKPLWPLMDSIYVTAGPSVDILHPQPVVQEVSGDERELHSNPRAFLGRQYSFRVPSACLPAPYSLLNYLPFLIFMMVILIIL